MNYYFLGIGGIGMSALARFFHRRGDTVSGYDRTPSPLTDELRAEGIDIGQGMATGRNVYQSEAAGQGPDNHHLACDIVERHAEQSGVARLQA